MKEKIIEKASEMFLNLGFKSVTMDDLANEMGISKKTIYLHFPNKTKLVEATTQGLLDMVCTNINCIRGNQENPIKELFEINEFIKQYVDNEKASPLYQLQKYYPKIFKNLKSDQFCFMMENISENLKVGIKQGLYRPEIKVEVVSKFYFLGATGIRDTEIFPSHQYNFSNLLQQFLEYHLRGIVTKKGEIELNKYLKT